jgi:hypothetical protein
VENKINTLNKINDINGRNFGKNTSRKVQLILNRIIAKPMLSMSQSET